MNFVYRTCSSAGGVHNGHCTSIDRTGTGYGGYTEEQGMVGTQRSRVWWVHRGAVYGGYTEEQCMVDTQRSSVWWVHIGAGYGGYTEEQGMVGTQRSRVWWVHRGAGYDVYTEEQGMVGTQPSYMYIFAITHPGLTIYHAGCIYSYNALTSSLVLISAPLSSRATTLAVRPSFDARRSKIYIYK